MKIREKRTVSGNLLEVDFYPIFDDGRRLPSRSPKSKPTAAEQKKYNQTMATKKFVRLVNANFDNTDYIMHPTYTPRNSPQSEAEARRDISNFFRRVKTRRASELKKLDKLLTSAEAAAQQMPENKSCVENVENLKLKIKKLNEPFRYIYVIEKQVYKSGIYAGRANFHFHLFCTGGIDARDMEKLWHGGVRVNCNRYQPDAFGPEAAALYMCKDPQGSKRFSYSRNLKKPVEKCRDDKVSRRTVERMAHERAGDAQYWERRYKGYRFMRTYNRFNPYNGHWYVSAVMYRTSEEPPDWNAPEWITTDY